MTQEDKNILINDLCARLTHGVIAMDSPDEPPFRIVAYDGVDFFDDGDWEHKVEQIKPYLYPLSSMTEEQKCEYDTLYTYDAIYMEPHWECIDWLNKNHFDYRGLIEKGLAIDVSKLDIDVYTTYKRI